MTSEQTNLRNRIAEQLYVHNDGETVESAFRGADAFIAELSRREKKVPSQSAEELPTVEEIEREIGCSLPTDRELGLEHMRKIAQPILASKNAEIERLKATIRLMKAAEDKWLPCPDHRDKLNGGCYVCENERLTRELSSERSKPKPEPTLWVVWRAEGRVFQITKDPNEANTLRRFGYAVCAYSEVK